MKLVTYNIQYSLGKDGRYDLARIADEVAGADIIALQEVERFWQRTGECDQPAKLGRLLAGYHWIYGPPFDVDASFENGEGRLVRRRRQFGNMLLARWPILTSRLFLLPRFGTLAKFNPQYGALEGVVDTPAGPLRVYSLHLGYTASAERQAQLQALLPKVRAVPSEGTAWSGHEAHKAALWQMGDGPPPAPSRAVLMGDFNFTHASPEYDLIAGPADPVYGRQPIAQFFVDSWVAAGNDEAAGVTCPSDFNDDEIGDLRIDYIYLSPELAPAIRSARIDSAAKGSDHQPYWVELDL